MGNLNRILAKVTGIRRSIKANHKFLSFEDYANIDDAVSECYSKVVMIIWGQRGDKNG
jgi:hypothetical protein